MTIADPRDRTARSSRPSRAHAKRDTAPTPREAGSSRPAVIFRSQLLHPSETFVLQQGEHLSRYEACYVGARRVNGLPMPGHRTVTLNGEGVLGKRGRILGAAREASFKLSGRSPTLERRLRALEPALIHAHFADDGTVALPLARRLGLPLVVTLHGGDVTLSDAEFRRGTPIRRVYLARMAQLKREARLFLTSSDYIRRTALARGYPAERTRVHYTGVDTAFFAPDPDAIPRRAVLFVGRLIPSKGPLHLLRAMQRLDARGVDAEVVYCGDGPLRPQLEAEARNLSMPVRFLGVQDPGSVVRWMRHARVFCVPSTLNANGGAEGFGMVFIEAQAVGVPVVSFRTGGIPEAVADGETGILASDGDVQELADALERLLRDDLLRRRMSAKCRSRVLQAFDLDRQCRRLETIYDEVAASSHD